MRELSAIIPADGLESRLQVIRHLQQCSEPTSIYHVAKAMGWSTNKAYNHITALLAEGVVLPAGENMFGKPKYVLHPYLVSLNEHLEPLRQMAQDIIACNPDAESEQVLATMRYSLALVQVTEEEECAGDDEATVPDPVPAAPPGPSEVA